MVGRKGVEFNSNPLKLDIVSTYDREEYFNISFICCNVVSVLCFLLNKIYVIG